METKWIEKKYPNVKWEIIYSNTEIMEADMDYKDLNTPTNNESQNIILRTIINNKEAIISTNNLTNFKDIFNKCVKMTKLTKDKKIISEINSTEKFNKNKINFKDFNEDKIITELIDMKNYLDNRAKLTNLNITKQTSNIIYQNYLGARVEFKTDTISSNIEIGNNKRVGYSNIIERTKYPNFKQIVDEAVNYYNLSKNNINITKGNYEVIFANDAFNTILTPIKHSLKGNNVVEKKSKYEKELNNKILSEKITIKDNPNNLYNFNLIDSEGHKTLNQNIVVNGVLKTFIHDNYTSKLLNQKNTFNSSSITIKPSTNFHNISITGKVKQEEMIKNTKKGFIFYDLYPGHTINKITGTFGLNSSLAYKIEDGEIKGQCKGIVVTGNSYDMLKKVISISKEKKTNIGNYELGMIKTKANILI